MVRRAFLERSLHLAAIGALGVAVLALVVGFAGSCVGIDVFDAGPKASIAQVFVGSFAAFCAGAVGIALELGARLVSRDGIGSSSQ